MFDRVGEVMERIGAALGRLWEPLRRHRRHMAEIAAVERRVAQMRREIEQRYGLASRRWDKDEHDG